MSAICTDTYLETFSPLVNCSVDNVSRRVSVQMVFTARAYARAVLGVVILSVCPSVCLSVTRVDCDKTK